MEERLKLLQLRHIPLLTIVPANVQWIRDKVGGIQVNATHIQIFRGRMHYGLLRDVAYKHSAALVRLSDCTEMATPAGRLLYVNQRWCRNISIRETVRSPDTELLSVCVCPFYLPREFPHIF